MRPSTGDYAPYYSAYIDKINEDDPILAMVKSLSEAESFFNALSEEKASTPYAPGKWSYKETLGHIMDTERIMAYRALCIARGETKALPGFEQDDYVRNGNFNSRKLSDLLEEYRILRKSSIILFKSLSEDELNRKGIASKNIVTVLALGFIIAGHDRHHISVLKSYSAL